LACFVCGVRAFFVYSCCDHRDLHSFPTRRSSDLDPRRSLRRCAPVRAARCSRRGSAVPVRLPGPRTTAWVCLQPCGSRRTRLGRSEEHTSELHHVKISYAVFCLKKKKKNDTQQQR